MKTQKTFLSDKSGRICSIMIESLTLWALSLVFSSFDCNFFWEIGIISWIEWEIKMGSRASDTETKI